MKLPNRLLGESPLAKLLYLWLEARCYRAQEPQGEVRASTRSIGAALGLSQPSVYQSLNRLRELGVLEDVVSASGDAPPTLRITVPLGGRRRGVTALPPALLAEAPSVKLLWLWLKPQGKVNYTVRELEEVLGLAHRTVHAALARLASEELTLLERFDGETRRRSSYRAKSGKSPA